MTGALWREREGWNRFDKKMELNFQIAPLLNSFDLPHLKGPIILFGHTAGGSTEVTLLVLSVTLEGNSGVEASEVVQPPNQHISGH